MLRLWDYVTIWYVNTIAYVFGKNGKCNLERLDNIIMSNNTAVVSLFRLFEVLMLNFFTLLYK